MNMHERSRAQTTAGTHPPHGHIGFLLELWPWILQRQIATHLGNMMERRQWDMCSAVATGEIRCRFCSSLYQSMCYVLGQNCVLLPVI